MSMYFENHFCFCFAAAAGASARARFPLQCIREVDEELLPGELPAVGDASGCVESRAVAATSDLVLGLIHWSYSMAKCSANLRFCGYCRMLKSGHAGF